VLYRYGEEFQTSKLKILLSFLALIFFSDRITAQTARTLSPREISQLIPTRVVGFSARADSKSAKQRIGNLTYSYCQNEYRKDEKFLKILLFDYLQASIMYDQALASWRKMEQVQTDSAFFKRWDSNGITGWQTVHSTMHTSQIALGINNRFFLLLEASNVPIDELKRICESLQAANFPGR
jgi:hypothetical protein